RLQSLALAIHPHQPTPGQIPDRIRRVVFHLERIEGLRLRSQAEAQFSSTLGHCRRRKAQANDREGDRESKNAYRDVLSADRHCAHLYRNHQCEAFPLRFTRPILRAAKVQVETKLRRPPATPVAQTSKALRPQKPILPTLSADFPTRAWVRQRPAREFPSSPR